MRIRAAAIGVADAVAVLVHERGRRQGAVVDPLKGNLLILYMEQRAGKWVPQKSVSLDEAATKVTVSNIAGTGAWWLVALKAQ